MKTRTVTPCGYLVAGLTETYLLLSPEPVAKDSWQDNGTYRFVCVPIEPIHTPNMEDFIVDGDEPIYNYARHVVTTCFALEYRTDMKPIKIKLIETEENYE